MPTLLRRPYYRKLTSIGKTEKLLGLFLLLLVGGIVIAYFLQAAGNREYLFNVDQAALLGNTEPRERAIARQMLPAIGEGEWPQTAATWKDATEAEAIPPGEFSAKLGDTAAALLAFDTQWVYRRRYATGESPTRELTIIVCDVTSPTQAFGLWRARRPRPSRDREGTAEALEIGRGGWRAVDGLSVGFWNGRYYTELRASDDLSNGGPALAEAAAVIASLQLSYGGPFSQEKTLPPEERAGWPILRAAKGGEWTVAADASPQQTSEMSPFPEPGTAGWRRPRKADRFTPANLYEKINGRAAAFLQFHFKGLTFGTYFHQSDPNRTIDVYWYDMGESLNAFGIYRSEAPHDPARVSLGREAYQTVGAVFFWKGADYVQVLPAGEDEADAKVALEVARRIAKRIEGGDEDLWASTILPQAGRVPDSLQFTASDVFGLDFLEDVFTADYDTDGVRLTLFIHRAQNEESAQALLDRYVAFFQRYGRLSWSDPDASRGIVEGNVAGMIDVVFAKGRYLGGVAGAEDSTAARKAAAAFYELVHGP